ncbi:hypothetical protein FSP39_015378 [Pinctada imbricata]|uniref:TIR domain-containing protein n=1 Tax=Pinctada imbricata TaxID=66713 RepID=A0AA88YIP9_PINIB|nr:hypothetical protein FSP39_015378 [Pinctada imbricata]
MGLLSIFLFHYTLICGILSHGTPNICPALCQCAGHKAYCMQNGNKLTVIPPLPPNITYLKFHGNSLHEITRRTFMTIKANNITEMDLSNNRVSTISADALEDLTFLKRFSFSHEILTDGVILVAKLLHSISRSIEYVGLQNMHWNTVPNLDGLINTTIREFDFSYNYLEFLDGTHFAKLNTLRELVISYNGIGNSNYSFDGLQMITNLNLAGNWFINFPNFTNMQQLKRLHLQNTKISYFEQKNFDGLAKLEYLNLNGHAIRRLLNYTFLTLKSLRTLELRRLSGQLYYIEPYAFNSSSLRNLSMNENYFDFTSEFINIFASVPTLESLDLSYNNIRVNETDFLKMINPLPKLKYLKLVNVKFTFISNNLLRSLRSLRHLILSQNNIITWDGKAVFGNSTTLRVIDLSNNSITIVNDTSFPQPMRNRLKVLNLEGNPFSCSCNDMKWFYKWMSSEAAVKLLNLDRTSERYKCSSPYSLQEKQINQLDYRDVCPIDPTLLKVIISCAAMIGSVLLVVGLLYKCRWNIRYQLFKLNQERKRRYKRDGYVSIPRDNDYLYDCFPVYADEDIRFVQNRLMKVLEEKYNRTLCIRDRDFGIGKVFVDNITESIEDSRKVLLLLSNNFARSRWCRFQLQIALHRMTEEGRNELVIVVLQEISYKYLSNSLRTVMVTTPYITWSDESSAERMFWEKILQEIPSSGMRRTDSVVEEVEINDSIAINSG